MKKNGLVKEDACDRTKFRDEMKSMAIRNPANSSTGKKPGSKLNCWWWFTRLLFNASVQKRCDLRRQRKRNTSQTPSRRQPGALRGEKKHAHNRLDNAYKTKLSDCSEWSSIIVTLQIATLRFRKQRRYHWYKHAENGTYTETPYQLCRMN